MINGFFEVFGKIMIWLSVREAWFKRVSLLLFVCVFLYADPVTSHSVP